MGRPERITEEIPVPTYLGSIKPELDKRSTRSKNRSWFLKLALMQNSVFGFFVPMSKADERCCTYWGLRGRPLTWWSQFSISEVLSSMPIFFCVWYCGPDDMRWTDNYLLAKSAAITVAMMVGSKF